MPDVFVLATDAAREGRRSAFALPEFRGVYRAICHLEEIYPQFRRWFVAKVVEQTTGEKRALFVYRRHHTIVGVAIAKRSREESKFCTLWVHPAARSVGIAGALGQSVFEWLGNDRPLFTVPEEKLVEFRPLLRRWRFAETQQAEGAYRVHRIEHVFNGDLRPKLNLQLRS